MVKVAVKPKAAAARISFRITSPQQVELTLAGLDMGAQAKFNDDFDAIR
jgi:hypothetical protein